MWFAPALADSTVPLPVNTPIPCLVCRAEPSSLQTFSGTVKLAEPGRIDVFDGKNHQTMRFTVPGDFRGVESSDGTIVKAAVNRAAPGLLARVTYRTGAGGRAEVTRVVLLTLNQCRSLKAAERLSDTPSDCPD